MSDATRRHADDFLAGQQGKAKCYDYEQEGAPAITINDGDMEVCENVFPPHPPPLPLSLLC